MFGLSTAPQATLRLVFVATALGLALVGHSAAATVFPMAGQIGATAVRQIPLSGAHRGPQRASNAYKTLYNFGSANGDGIVPNAGLLPDGKAALYGTTEFGGANGSNFGAVFKVTAAGVEHTLYSFAQGAGDGFHPAAALTVGEGGLYGTTGGGGTGSLGTVFSVSFLGKERVVHSFLGGSDASIPQAPLLSTSDTGSIFMGTSATGGGPGCVENYAGCGTVFAVSSRGKERIIYSFKGGTDGFLPLSGLVPANSAYAGTTEMGGKGYGTVFEIDARGEHILYRFKGAGAGDGEYPLGGMTYWNGLLWGTTSGGGLYGHGTIFLLALHSHNAYSLVYSFKGSSDGSTPYGNLIRQSGQLYGTTFFGGGAGCGNDGCGTVFKLDSSGTESVLHAFAGGSTDGANPTAGVVYFRRLLYGTTTSGGSTDGGTVFQLTP